MLAVVQYNSIQFYLCVCNTMCMLAFIMNATPDVSYIFVLCLSKFEAID